MSPAADGLLVHGSAGPFERRPELLPASLLAGGAPGVDEAVPLAGSRALAEVVGFDGQWVELGMPGVPDGTMVVGCPGGVSADGLVAEFAVLLTDGDTAAALEIAERLVRLVEEPVVLSGRPTRVGASVGVVCGAPGAGLDAEQLMQRADVAMYAAKARGKHRVQVFDPTLLLVDGPDALVADLA